MSITYRLSKPVKGSEICDKVIKAFEESVEKDVDKIEYLSWFKVKTKERRKYFVRFDKDFEFAAGDSGPKEVFNGLKITYGQFGAINGCSEQHKHEHRQISFKIEGNKEFDSVELKCYYRDSDHGDFTEIEKNSTTFKKELYEALVKKTVEVLHCAIYGKTEDSPTGLDTAEKIL